MAGVGFQFSPGAFRTKDADPEGTLEMFEKYCESMTRAFRLNRRTDPTTGLRVEFDDTDKKDIIQLEGGGDMQDLFKHVGKVLDADTYQQAIGKIIAALKKRGNRSAAVFKLFTRMNQGGRTFESWYKEVYEAAKRIDWTGYGAETATVDAIIMQTSSQKLQQKAIQEKPSYNEMVDLGISIEQAKKKAESMPDGEGTEITRALAEEVRQLKQKLGKAESSKDTCKSCMLLRCKRGDKCPAKDKKCHRCEGTGHFTRSPLCPKKKKGKGNSVNKVQEGEEEIESDSSVGRVLMVGKVGGEDSRIRVKLGMTGPGSQEYKVKFEPLTDTGVRRTIINKTDWKMISGECNLMPTKLKFRPYGTNKQLPIIGRAKIQLKAEAGAVIETFVYVNDDATESSLLGEKDAQRLGIVTICPEGAPEEVEVRKIKYSTKEELSKTKKAQRHSQEEVERNMQRIAGEHLRVFQGIGKFKGAPIKIQVEDGATPVIQPPRRIPMHYREPLREHLKEMLEQDVIEGPLQEEEAGTWISNLVITGKKWDAGVKEKGERRHIRANLDCRPLNKVVYQTHEPIPTVEELRHSLGGSQRFSKLDMTHCFHQFEI